MQNTGSRAQDVTGDDWPDLVARQAGTGELLVYPHVGRWEGAGSWPTPVVAGHGWQIMDWIGLGEVTGDDWVDVIARRADDGVLLVYPHTGVFRGDQTWGDPVVVGHGWGGLRTIVVQDVTLDGFHDLVVRWGRDGDDSTYVYVHSRTFQGVGTWGERERAGEHALDSWLMATEWSGDDGPDLLHHNFELGTLFLSPHNRAFARENTWSSAPPIQVSGGQWFTYDKVDYLLLADADGDGYEDVLSRQVNGELWAYLNTRRLDGAATLRPPVTIGWGWNTFDMIT
ncbi:hypothetical protein BKA00_002540 [Actinomadura coerulea]|uniref:VCBS repeat-containing protein n=1 Tax=Actinomadura coerulea TaxID=46159 RepID=A0A7X0KYP3_9ACTN|nr:hypothetical protein [Actinomadura coerulea]MBB6395626.1 hypothetical protein [Actinomadura coerulea]GGQ25002.1 hypothetical protein GCM10010187_46770 [Actinomadura coerulea]